MKGQDANALTLNPASLNGAGSCAARVAGENGRVTNSSALAVFTPRNLTTRNLTTRTNQ